ncbi:hypothetical protein RCL1_004962 [Eukaryota sp. TZLM3-RCL]
MLLQFLLLTQIVIAYSSSQPSWCPDVVSSPTSTTPLTTLLPNRQYFLRVRVCVDSSPSLISTSSVFSSGNHPIITINSGHLGLSSYNFSHNVNSPPSVSFSSWIFAFTTSRPHIISLSLRSSSIAANSFPPLATTFDLFVSSLHFMDSGILRVRLPLVANFPAFPSLFSEFSNSIAFRSSSSVLSFSKISHENLVVLCTIGSESFLIDFTSILTNFPNLFVDQSIRSILSFDHLLFVASNRGLFVFNLSQSSQPFRLQSKLIDSIVITDTSRYREFLVISSSYLVTFTSSEFEIFGLEFSDDSDWNEFELFPIVDDVSNQNLIDYLTNSSSFSPVFPFSKLSVHIFPTFPQSIILIVFDWNMIFSIHVEPFSFHLDFTTEIPTETSMTSSPFDIPITTALVELRGSKSTNSELFLYGNELLYSLDQGRTFHRVLEINDVIQSISIGPDHSVVILTVSNRLIVGSTPNFDCFEEITVLYLNSTFPIKNPLTITTNFDLLIPTLTSSSPFISNHVISFETLKSLAQNCQDQSFITSSFPSDPYILRSNDLFFYWLPDTIYLGYGQCTDFSISTYSNFPPNYLLQRQQYVSVTSSVQSFSGSNLQIFTYRICDLKTPRQQSSPGNNLLLSLFKLNIPYSSFACNRIQDHVISSKSMSILTGCLPGQSISLRRDHDLIEDLSFFDCYDDDVCNHFLSDFDNSYYYHDLITGKSRPFPGKMSFSIIGGGHNRQSIELYSQDLIDLYNEGSLSIYTSFPSPDNLTTFIRFLCPKGTPCHGVWGSIFPFKQPKYSFKILAQSIESEFGDYCLFETEFDLTIVGLPMGINHSILITCVLALFLLFINLIIFIRINFKRRKLIMDDVSHDDTFDDVLG